jgi:glycosyltransferase involved in cell wall biosynthesis
LSRTDKTARRVLFVQATEPAAYPPLIHASSLMAEAGWDVTFLSAPAADMSLVLPSHPRITVRAIHARPSYIVGKMDYLRYMAAAGRLALSVRPDVVYASDPLGAGPGLFAARLARASLVYHEHDTPAVDALRPWLRQLRRAASRTARLVVFPNETRARSAQTELGFRDENLRIVWNVPRRNELREMAPIVEGPLLLYYHGSITPHRLPETVVEAVLRLVGRVRLRIAGYEAPSAPGYVARLVERGAVPNGEKLVEYVGQVSRDNLLVEAAQAHIGLALMPLNSADLNMRHMTGASNKAFDYMAAGLALLVSNLDDWRDMFVAPGYARACDPSDADSVAAMLGWFLDHPEERQAMAARGRAKIETDWNYDTQFAPVMRDIERWNARL